VDPLVIAVGGRIVLAGKAGAELEAHPESDPLAGIRAALSGAHLRVASLEGPLGGKSPAGGEARARALSRGTLDVLSSANAASKEALSSAGIRVATPPESGPSDPQELSVQGWTVTLLATLPDGTTGGAGPTGLEGRIERARKAGAVVLVVDTATPSDPSGRPLSTSLATRALSAGADAVLGASSRVPQGVSWVSGRPALHGLGSLLADDDPKDPWTARGVFARLRFFRDGRRDVSLCPYRLASGLPRLLAGPSRPTEEGIFSRTLARLSDAHGGLTLSEPDLHSCLKLSPPGAGRPDAG